MWAGNDGCAFGSTQIERIYEFGRTMNLEIFGMKCRAASHGDVSKNGNDAQECK